MTDPATVLATSSIIYKNFNPKHYDLFIRTWGPYIAKGEAKPISETQLRLQYEANPAGSSALTIMEEDGVWIGTIAAIATSIITSDGTKRIAYQIGDFMVDPKYQGRGLGGKLLCELTGFLQDVAIFVYTFPNARSIGVFLKQAYLELRCIPVVIYPVLPTAILGKLRWGAKSRVTDLPIEQACKVADDLSARPRAKARIHKSGDYLHWRYGEMRDSSDYSFTLVERPKGAAPSLVVWSLFRYRGIPFQVIVDTLGEGEAGPALCEVASMGMGRGALLGVNNVERGPGWALPPFSVRVPRRFDPRPARLLVRPDDAASKEMFSECLFTTGDWMGF